MKNQERGQATDDEFGVKENQSGSNKLENSRTVYLSDLCVAAHLLCVALWVAAHMRDEICYEEQAPALTGYQIANIRDSTLDSLVSTYMTRIPGPTARPCPYCVE